MAMRGVSSWTVAGVSRFAPELALLALLVAEFVCLTVAFDTQSLDKLPSLWAQLINWSPQYFRLATTIAVVTLLLGARQLLFGIGDLHPDASPRSRLLF